MKYGLKVKNIVSSQLQEAYEWYEDKKSGLGDELANEVNECLTAISDYPYRYAALQQNDKFRRIRVSRFPYLLIYFVEKDTVVVHRLVHFKQGKRF